MQRVPTTLVKARSREVTAEIESWGSTVYDHLVPSLQRCTVVDVAADGTHLVAHSPTYAQVCVLGGLRRVVAPHRTLS